MTGAASLSPEVAAIEVAETEEGFAIRFEMRKTN